MKHLRLVEPTKYRCTKWLSVHIIKKHIAQIAPDFEIISWHSAMTSSMPVIWLSGLELDYAKTIADQVVNPYSCIALPQRGLFTILANLASTRPLDQKKPITRGEIGVLKKHVQYTSGHTNKNIAIIESLLEIPRHLTPKHTEQGLEWLIDSQLKQDGTLRDAKTVFLGEREASILKNFYGFTLQGFITSSVSDIRCPVYRVHALNGDYFDYYTDFNNNYSEVV